MALFLYFFRKASKNTSIKHTKELENVGKNILSGKERIGQPETMFPGKLNKVVPVIDPYLKKVENHWPFRISLFQCYIHQMISRNHTNPNQIIYLVYKTGKKDVRENRKSSKFDNL